MFVPYGLLVVDAPSYFFSCWLNGRLLCVGSVCKATGGLDFSGGLTPSIISAVVNLEPGMFAYKATVAYGMHAAGHSCMATRRPVVAGLIWPLYVGLSLLAATLPQGSASLVAFPCVSLPWSFAPVLVLALPHAGVSRYDSLALLYGGPSLRTWYAQALTGRLPALVAPRTATIGIASACPGMVPISQARSLHYERSIATVSCASWPSAPAFSWDRPGPCLVRQGPTASAPLWTGTWRSVVPTHPSTAGRTVDLPRPLHTAVSALPAMVFSHGAGPWSLLPAATARSAWPMTIGLFVPCWLGVQVTPGPTSLGRCLAPQDSAFWPL
ncbi:hypothetical protein V6N11_047343 [Hibiscus sabdariffa]|uniref:Uncharacterized protein n=1 Tax=Hibiscus sabdariffa TaxID=183260 RepID=A0ABR2PBP4_9ROSI